MSQPTDIQAIMAAIKSKVRASPECSDATVTSDGIKVVQGAAMHIVHITSGVFHRLSQVAVECHQDVDANAIADFVAQDAVDYFRHVRHGFPTIIF